MEHTYHKLIIESTEELEAGEILQVEPYAFLELLGELGMRATIAHDDATQHLVFVEFPIIPKDYDEE